MEIIFPIIKKVVMFVPDKLIAINKNVNRIINLSETADKTFKYVTKVTGSPLAVQEYQRELSILQKL